MADPNDTPTEPVEPAQCASCAFWKPDGERLLPVPAETRGGITMPRPAPPEGDCIYNPPTTYPVASAGPDGPRLLSVWSRTRADESCGAHEPIASE